MVRIGKLVATSFAAAVAFGGVQAMTAVATTAAAQEYACCNVPKRDWLPDFYTEAECIKRPKHEPKMQSYDGWKICERTHGSPPNPPGTPDDGDDGDRGDGKGGNQG